MRILIASRWFLELVVPQQGAALQALGHDVALLVSSNAWNFGNDPRAREQHLAKFELPRFELAGNYKRPAAVVPFLRTSREVRAWQPDAVSVHQNFDPFMWATVNRFPLSYTIHDPEPHPGARYSRFEAMMDRRWVDSAGSLVVHSSRLLGQLPPELRSDPRITVIPHGVDISERPLPTPAEPTILMFGRLEEYKGVEVLMEAMPIVWENRPDVRLVVAGKGPLANAVIEHPQVTLIDRYIREDELPDLLSKASVSVLPYTQASQSGVGMLSLSHGIPIVATDVGGLADLVPDRALLATPNDPGSLAKALLAGLEVDDSGRERTWRYALDEFSWRTVSSKYADILQELAAGRQ